MAYKSSRLDKILLQRHFEETLNLAMHHIGANYPEALELVFTPVREQGGLSVADFVRRGQLNQAKRVLVELIDSRKRMVGSSRVSGASQNY